eukprot:scaffold41876_cov59-Cyclotella_meneghiniana.AAC.2
MDDTESEYMCCFLAKEKRMVVFELALKAVVVELQMKTKLNFWRYLPPEADGGVLTFMLITPIGGFHWKPLDDSPRPIQMWKRGSELEAKKILAYEEGGSNGRLRSTVALVLASESTSDAAVEAYCISLDTESSRLCISTNLLGAALYRHPDQPGGVHFLPYVVYVFEDESSQAQLCIQELSISTDDASNDKTLSLGEIAGSVHLDIDTTCYDAPTLSIGTSPKTLCCCLDGFIVVAMRAAGLIFAYDFSAGDLSLIGRITLDHFIVDAAMRYGNKVSEVEVVVLICETNDMTLDGRIATITLSRD